MTETKLILKQTQEVLNRAIEKARQKRNEEDRKYIIANIGQDLTRILTPLLQQIAENARIGREDIKEIIKEIKVEAPNVNVAPPEVNVQTPKAEVEVKVDVPKIPPIKVNVPAPKVTVKPADLKLPKEMEIKDMGKLLKMLEKSVVKKVKLEMGGVNRDKPLNVILTDEKGGEYKALTSVLSGGGGGVVTARRIEDIPVGFEQLAVLVTATKLASIPDKANKAIMTVEDATMRYRDDGTDPTATVGLRAFIGNVIILNSRQAITNFRAIRTGGSNSELNVNYYESK